LRTATSSPGVLKFCTDPNSGRVGARLTGLAEGGGEGASGRTSGNDVRLSLYFSVGDSVAVVEGDGVLCWSGNTVGLCVAGGCPVKGSADALWSGIGDGLSELLSPIPPPRSGVGGGVSSSGGRPSMRISFRRESRCSRRRKLLAASVGVDGSRWWTLCLSSRRAIRGGEIKEESVPLGIVFAVACDLDQVLWSWLLVTLGSLWDDGFLVARIVTTSICCSDKCGGKKCCS
jgi:hypothetical protein